MSGASNRDLRAAHDRHHRTPRSTDSHASFTAMHSPLLSSIAKWSCQAFNTVASKSNAAVVMSR